MDSVSQNGLLEAGAIVRNLGSRMAGLYAPRRDIDLQKSEILGERPRVHDDRADAATVIDREPIGFPQQRG
jgi:hypothetical protein